MSRNVRLTATALGISFVGSLPLGTLNVSVSELAGMHHIAGAVQFGIAAILVEVLLVRIALAAVAMLSGLRRYFVYFHLATIIVLLIVATYSLRAAWQGQMFEASAMPLAYLQPFAAGLLLSLLNPLHLPFWMGWTAVLRSKGLMDDSPLGYNLFITGIGLGTTLAFAAYGWAGQYLQEHLQGQQPLINAVVGLALLGTAIFQTYKLFLASARSPIQ